MVAITGTESATSRTRNRTSSRLHTLTHPKTRGPARESGVPGRRYLQTETGRWLSRDPIEEEGGLNVYLFCDNRSITEIDWLGLEWRIRRRHESRALAAVRCDTVARLAWEIGLDEREFVRWLRVVDGHLPRTYDEIIPGPEVFSIPNTVFLRIGYLTQEEWDADHEDMVAWQGLFRWAYDGQGFRTVASQRTMWADAYDSIRHPDVFGFVYQGHGPLMSFYGGSGGAREYLRSRTARPHHGLAFVVHMGCLGFPSSQGADYSAWVSKNGLYRAHRRDVTARDQGFGLIRFPGTYRPR